MAGLAAYSTKMAVFVWQPFMRGLRIVAVSAIAHRIVDFIRKSDLGAVAACELVQWLVQVLANFQAAGIESQVIGLGAFGFLIIEWVIERVMAVGAFE